MGKKKQKKSPQQTPTTEVVCPSQVNQRLWNRFCYESRHSETLKVINRRAGEHSVQESDLSNGARNKSSVNGIIRRMVADPSACEFYQNEIQKRNETFGLMLEKRIQEEYKDPDFKLRIHAEIILLDLFHRNKLRYLDRIAYIGVSKPSCFLCYRYIQAHPLQVQTSGCSNNLYLKWQPPYIYENSPSLVKEQEDILNVMLKGVRLFVLDNLVPGYQGVKSHPDSTTGLDTISHIDNMDDPFKEVNYHETEIVDDEAEDDSAGYLDENPAEYEASSPLAEFQEYRSGVGLSLPTYSESTMEMKPDKQNTPRISDKRIEDIDDSDNSEDGGVPLF
ncbi:hypothetical protein Dda_4047 [Drechslerella dactyloides]|uniref:Uncharacterized protein n=1 Tax=Drechslerella dactyloides TaxID=74499 RepID=A0AAD6IZW8_DREDA|nr:hypothetical protein Dda_4047 [Drechslerella dactyloides]